MTTVTSSLQGDTFTQASANDDVVDAAISRALTTVYGVRVDPNEDGTVTVTDNDPDVPHLTLSWPPYGQIPFQYRRRTSPPLVPYSGPTPLS